MLSTPLSSSITSNQNLKRWRSSPVKKVFVPVIGRRDGTSALIKVSEECTFGKVLHELLHTLGLLHEQINPLKPFSINFDRLIASWVDQYTDDNPIALTEHDVHSIMHYHSFDNSICSSLSDLKWSELPASRLPDKSCRQSKWKSVVDCRVECAVFLHPTLGPFGGERVDLSPLDIQGLKKLYQRAN